MLPRRGGAREIGNFFFRRRADGGNRTHTLRFTRALLNRLSFAGTNKYPRQESNLPLPASEAGVLPPHPGDIFTYAAARLA